MVHNVFTVLHLELLGKSGKAQNIITTMSHPVRVLPFVLGSILLNFLTLSRSQKHSQRAITVQG